MLHIKEPKCIIGILLLYAYLFHGCQQPGLHAGEDDIAQSAPPAQKSQAKQGTQALTIPNSPGTGLIMTSSSDSSPDAKQVTVATRGIVAKRPSNRQPGEEEASLIATKRAKKEETLPNHKAWFTSFTQAVAQVEQDSGNEAAWDTVEDILIAGKKHDFLMRSIVCPNDSNPDTEYEYTPLHYAASRGILSLVKELVVCEKVPADIQTTNKQNTPLHLAASRGHLDVVQFLVEQGANPNLLDSKGGSTLHYAAAGNHGEMARDIIYYLVKKDTDFKKTVHPGTSMLDVAVMSGNIPVVEYWEDNYKNNPDSAIDVMTREALALAQYRFKKYVQERGVQKTIIRILKIFMQSRQENKQADNAGK